MAMSDLLARYVKQAPPVARDIGDAWKEAAGRYAAASVVLRTSRNGVVTVACADASVAQEIAARSERLGEALERAAGIPVRGMRVVIADHALPADGPAPTPPPGPPGEAARAAAAGIAAQVEDEQVRAAIERALAADLQRRWTR